MEFGVAGATIHELQARERRGPSSSIVPGSRPPGRAIGRWRQAAKAMDSVALEETRREAAYEAWAGSPECSSRSIRDDDPGQTPGLSSWRTYSSADPVRSHENLKAAMGAR